MTTLTLYLLGFSLLPGKWGGCALVEGHSLQCTFGSVAECTLDTLSTCAVPIYAREVGSLDQAKQLTREVLDHDPTWLGPPIEWAVAKVITARFTAGQDARGSL